jgi:hypothetical protein
LKSGTIKEQNHSTEWKYSTMGFLRAVGLTSSGITMGWVSMQYEIGLNQTQSIIIACVALTFTAILWVGNTQMLTVDP